jgi:alkaline phosphatase D
MRIAFTSCSCTRVFGNQPLWDWIAAQAPDHLVLLGDSLYLDVLGPAHPRDMSEVEFAQHLHTLYGELIAQPQFAALVQALPAGAVHAIWDDHDFLWDGAQGAEVHPVHTGHVRLATAFLEAFRRALAQRFAPGSFPAAFDDAVFWDLTQPPLATPTVVLAPDLLLHLSDTRTFRTRTWLIPENRRTLFGPAQRAQFAAAIQAAPDAIHLWASGTTIAGYQEYAGDLGWLEGLAAGSRMLVLSGDIHRNRLDAFYTGGWPMHEATSSGAAVRDAVVVGATRRNHGLLDIDAATVAISLYRGTQREQRRVLGRGNWLPQ